MTEYKNNKLTFVSNTGIHKLIFELDISRQEALLDTIDIKYEAPVELALLLKDIGKQLKEKKIERIIQQINNNDWVYLKQQGYFRYESTNKLYNYINISCETDRFAEAVMKGLGFVDL